MCQPEYLIFVLNKLQVTDAVTRFVSVRYNYVSIIIMKFVEN